MSSPFSQQKPSTKRGDDSALEVRAVSRRQFLKGTALTFGAVLSSAALAACAAPVAPAAETASDAPTVITPQIKDIVLRQIGTGVSNINEIQQKAQEDLGFSIQMKSLSTTENNQIAITQPDSYDIFDGEYFSLPLVVPSGNLQPLDVSRITEFDKIAPLFITGKLTEDSVIAQGTAPHKVMFLTGEDSTEFASEPTGWATLIPTIYNADTLGYRPDLVGRTIETWAELFNPEFKGATSILDIPSIGIMDAAMAAEAAGLMTFGDKGDMTTAEIDQITDILKQLKADGQFRAFWTTFDESVNLMSSGEVVVQSMWSPAVTAVKSKGIECIYAPLKEGYRGWGGGLGLSANLEGMALDAAYDYINWWNSGWAGGFVGRQGYYSAIPENVKNYMSEDEWGFWYEGQPAQADIVDPFGTKLESAGASRDGGTFWDRMGQVVVWNSVMPEQDYLVQKWNEFIAS
jgi:putative spermidine/putrescine transport system substrate-binding protein